MASERERAVAAAVAAMRADADLLVIDGRTGRAAAHRPGSGAEPEAALVVVGPIDLGGEGYAVRPNRRDGSAGGDAADLAILTPHDRRRVRRERNRHNHAARRRSHAAPAATSAPHGAPDGRERPGARAAADEAPTRPEVRAI
ncbi:MAG TPA: hypothetical protein VEP91_11545 [Solirubrobacterales bacterium]|nr:hypothetical protein [Solirubrobacterales bacterium]